jgi:6-phosphogluconolactonase
MNRHVFASVNELYQAAALDFQTRASQAIAARGRFCVALAGGSTPKGVYAALAQLDAVPWSNIQLFWGDERCVPPDHLDSNFGMARETLLDHIAIPHENIHRIKGELGTTAATLEYQSQLEVIFDGVPVFDLIHLGLGFDGHTASLFPGQTTLENPAFVLEAFPNPDLSPQVARVSLGLTTINAARAVQFFVTGAGKASIFAHLGRGLYPADLVIAPEIRWWLDSAVLNGAVEVMDKS